MRQRYLRLISVLLLLAILTACGTDREGAAGGTVEGVVVERRLLVLLTDEGEYQAFEFERRDTGALEEGDCVSVTYTGESWARRLHANGRKYFQTIGIPLSLDCLRGICLRAEPGSFCAMLEKQEGGIIPEKKRGQRYFLAAARETFLHIKFTIMCYHPFQE